MRAGVREVSAYHASNLVGNSRDLASTESGALGWSAVATTLSAGCDADASAAMIERTCSAGMNVI